jgi:hypothetical protein
MTPATPLSVSSFFDAHLHAQGFQDVIPDPFALPESKVLGDGAPGRHIMGQESPRTAATQHVQDGIDDITSFVEVIGGVRTQRRDQGGQPLPLRIGEIGRIGPLQTCTEHPCVPPSPCI